MFLDDTSPYEELGRLLPSSAFVFSMNQPLFHFSVLQNTREISLTSPSFFDLLSILQANTSYYDDSPSVLYFPHYYLKTIVPDSTMRYDCLTIGCVCVYAVVIMLFKFVFGAQKEKSE